MCALHLIRELRARASSSEKDGHLSGVGWLLERRRSAAAPHSIKGHVKAPPAKEALLAHQAV